MQTTLVALSLLASPAAAQLTAVVGPEVAPLGGRVAITMSNDTGTDFLVGQACPFDVHTAGGTLVYSIDCPTLVPIPLAAGDAVTFFWDQVDDAFSPVPAGPYVLTVELPDGTTPQHPVTVAAVDAALHLEGVPKLGTSRTFYLESPSTPFTAYVLAASAGTSPGIPTCGGVVPLVPDGLFLQSLTPGHPNFLAFTGTLDGQGESRTSGLAIPGGAAFAGLSVSFAFVTVDLALPCPLPTVSLPRTITLVP